ncbi:MAG: tRNA (adenosine(37)-N6)-threonylcarbamoyltransferase complex ATPase subunit type 1 TsaE [Alphaproteobacteria bacterium]
MAFAKYLATSLWLEMKHIKKTSPLTILCDGDLGAGKTHFIKQVIKEWLGDDKISITSPTFSLVNIYEKNGIKILHGDFYRLENTHEAVELNLDDYALTHHFLLEWADKAKDYLPQDDLQITLRAKFHTPTDEGRDITLVAHGDFYKKFLTQFSYP